jgi:hypothetical protein
MRLQFQPSLFIRTSEPLIRVAVMLRLLIFSLSLTLLGMPSVHGFDGSDTEIPRIEEMSLVNKTALKANERIAILLKTSDDKNWVKLGGTLNIGFCAVATNNSGYMFIGIIGYTYLNGLAVIWIFLPLMI